MDNRNGKSVAGRTLYIPRMSYEGARAMAAAFQSAGINARPSPEGDARTYELARHYTNGDECLPELVTLGNFLKVTEQPDFDPGKTAFMMPTSNGPCRFGQYKHLLANVLGNLGLGDVLLFSPTSSDGYDGIGEDARSLIRRGWWAVIASDILRKLLLKTRPYEVTKGKTDQLFRTALDQVCDALSTREGSTRKRKRLLIVALEEVGEAFRRVQVDHSEPKPLIGAVGEIFCRLNDFSNNDIVRKIEEHGGEVWMSDIAEWTWYTDEEERVRLLREGRRLSREMLINRARCAVMRTDEHMLMRPFEHEFRGYEEPSHTRQILARSRPYLPVEGALGEMVLNVGKAIWYWEKGACGVIDISPFSCMNGVVCEAIYPRVSRDHDGIPIRTIYFDGMHEDLDRDLGIFMELVKNYQKRHLAQ